MTVQKPLKLVGTALFLHGYFRFSYFESRIVRYACKLVQLALNGVFVFNFLSITPEFGGCVW